MAQPNLKEEDEEGERHGEDIGGAVGPEQFHLLGRGGGEREDMAIAQKIDGIACGEKGKGNQHGGEQRKPHMAVEIMAQEEIAAEAGEIIEEPKLIPIARAEMIGGYKFAEIGQECGCCP